MMSQIAQAAQHLSGALQFATVSDQNVDRVDFAVFSAFADFLQDTYPLVHRQLTKHVINQHGLVFYWKGQSQQQRLLLTAHYDVVPASDEGWPYPPFSGHIQDGKIYGRGSFDDKGSLIAILEAVTSLLEEGFVPPYDIFLAFGFDEEVGGSHGAQHIASWFEQKGLIFDYVLDEGGAVADGSIMGIAKPVAVIGIAEKGNASFTLRFEGEGGHSSTPPKETAVSTMARFIHAAQSHPDKPRLTETVKAMLKSTAPYRRGIQKFVLRYPQLFSRLIIKTLQKNRQTAAMLRTTAAFTMAQGGSSHNVLPANASCTVNFRLLQGDSSEQALARMHSLGIPFEAVAIMRGEPTKSSRIDGPGMAHLRQCAAQIFPDAVITPYLMTGGTDCRHYDKVARDAYRFLPARVNEQELSLVHGRGEYLSIQSLQHMIDFYTLLIKTLV